MKKIWKYVAVALAVFYLFCLFRYMRTPVTSELVRSGVLENAIRASGFVVRDEALINADFAGSLQNAVLEGETVTKGQLVATLYNGKVDQKIQSALTQVNQKIADLEAQNTMSNLSGGDEVKIENQIKERISQMILSSRDRQFAKVTVAQNEIYKLSDQLQVLQGGAEPTTLESLRSEKAALEQQIQLERSDLYAPAHGVYTTAVDGLESVIAFDQVSQVTVSDLQKLEEANPSSNREIAAGQPAAKIICDFDWNFLTIADEEQVSGVSVGDEIQIRLPDYNDTLYNATVIALNPDGAGKVAVGVVCNKAMDFVRDSRKINADLVFKQYEGLKISASSLCEVDGKTGVYVRQENYAKFKEVEVLAQDNSYAIIKEDNTIDNNLMLYDEVITNGKNLYDGKTIG